MPDVIHVGFSKSASTFLRSFFLEHPQVFMVDEAHFFVPFERCHFERGKAYYGELFKEARPGQLKVESDEHLMLPLLHPVLRAAATTLEAVVEASARMKRTAPAAKIILVVRNQADLILSRYGEYVMSGRDIDFEHFVDEFLCSSSDGRNYYQNYYAKILAILQEDFSPANVLILLQEDLLRNELVAIEQLCAFLGLQPLPDEEETLGLTRRLVALDMFRAVARSGRHSKNTGLSLTGMRIMRRWNRTVVVKPQESWYRKADSVLPHSLYKFGVRALRVADFYLPEKIKGNKRTLLTQRVRDCMKQEFADDNERLGRMLSRDLSALGYPL